MKTAREPVIGQGVWFSQIIDHVTLHVEMVLVLLKMNISSNIIFIPNSVVCKILLLQCKKKLYFNCICTVFVFNLIYADFNQNIILITVLQ